MHPELKRVGSSGQISLGKHLAGKLLRVEPRPDGSMLLVPVVDVPESQLWTLQAPHRDRIERGLSWLAANAPRATDLDALEQSALKAPQQQRKKPKPRSKG